MGITTKALNVISANMTGSALITYIGIGTGSTTFASGNTTLSNETDRNIVNAYDLSTSSQVTMTSNFVPLEMSGTILKEFGTFTTGSSMPSRDVLAGSLLFDGEQELQIQSTFKFYID